MMVFSVYIIGDRPTERHPLRPGDHWQKPAMRNDKLEDIAKENPALASDNALLFIKFDEPVHPSAVQQNATVIQTDIPVAPTIAERQSASILLL